VQEEGGAGDDRHSRSQSRGRTVASTQKKDDGKGKKGSLGLWKMMALTVSMGGSQVSLP
jgi:hypothetical protein